MSSFFISSFMAVPVMLFRINTGKKIKLRDLALKKRSSYDVLSEAGKVQPKALDPSTYTAPNGASMRPLGDFQTSLVQSFRGKNVVVYAVPEGTKLPEDLILVHERDDHYSLQPAREMTVEELNQSITNFLQQNATVYTKESWLFTFRDGWQWSDEYQGYFRFKEDGTYEWYEEKQSGSSSSKNELKGSKKGKK